MIRVRFTVRGMMMAIAVVALYFGAEAAIGRGPECRDRANAAQRAALRYEQFARSGMMGIHVLDRMQRSRAREDAKEFRRIARQCEMARWLPWVTLPEVYPDTCGLVEPDHIYSVAEVLAWTALPAGLIGWIVCVSRKRVTECRGKRPLTAGAAQSTHARATGR